MDECISENTPGLNVGFDISYAQSVLRNLKLFIKDMNQCTEKMRN